MDILYYVLVALYYILLGYFYFMIANIILSWIPGIHETKFYQVMNRITNFYMGRFKGLIVIGMMDFTPILGFLIYQLGLQGLARLMDFLFF